MSVLLILIPFSILFAACFLGGFIWAVRSGQYEDTETPALRPLLEDPPAHAHAHAQAHGQRPGAAPQPAAVAPLPRVLPPAASPSLSPKPHPLNLE